MPGLLLHGDNTTTTGSAFRPDRTIADALATVAAVEGRHTFAETEAPSSERDTTSTMERHPSGSGEVSGAGAGKQPPGQRGGQQQQQQQQHRRARSSSQPIPQQPIAGPSRMPELDFSFMQHHFGGGAGGMQHGPAGYDEDAIARALLAMQQQQGAPGHSSASVPPAVGGPGPGGHPAMPQMPGAHGDGGQIQPTPGLPGGAIQNPQVMDMFMAMLPYLQALQQQQQQQHTQHPHPLQQGHGLPHHLPPQQPPPPPHPQAQFGQHTRPQHAQQQQQSDPLALPHPHQHPLQARQQHPPFPMHTQSIPPTLRPPSSQSQQPGGFNFMNPTHPQVHTPTHDVVMSHSFVGGHFGSLPPREQPVDIQMGESMPPPPHHSGQGSNTPSPEASTMQEPTETESVAIAEDKRRRNTAASARFRIKKKLWTLNLERTISDLSGRVEELEREASELRRENGWLKEIVMLKSKRFAGVVEPPPSLSATSSSAGGPGSDAGQGGGSGSEGQGQGQGQQSGGSRTGSREGSRESSTEPAPRRSRRGAGAGADEKGKGKARQRSP